MTVTRKYVFALLAIVLATALLQILLLTENWRDNPLARVMLGDAQTYWSWAAEIAGGQMIGDAPFHSAPLYAYLLGLLRALGCGLLGVYIFQAVLHLLTVALIAEVGRIVFRETTGLLAGALFALLLDPAYYTGRVLSVSLQLFVMALLLYQAAGLFGRRTVRNQIVLGLLSGLAILANPSLLLAVPVLAAWVAFSGERRDLRAGLITLTTALLTVAPATLHNLTASGEAVLVSAQAGVTFRHGNAPGANGTYRPIPGVSKNRTQQNQDAYRIAERATGQAGWASTSSYFMGLGLDYLRANPGQALVLESRKLWWLLTGRVYGDLYAPVLESGEPFGRRLHLLPLSLALILPLSLLGLWLGLSRDFRRSLPTALMFLMPCVVVLVFWYSPRYRIPLTPAAALLAAQALTTAWSSRRSLSIRQAESGHPVLLLVTLFLLVFGAGSGWLNRATRFDHPDLLRGNYLHLIGDAFRIDGRLEPAVLYLERALRSGSDTAESNNSLAQAQMKQAEELHGDDDPTNDSRGVELYQLAAGHLEAALSKNPELLQARRNLATLRYWFFEWGLGTADQARLELQAALQLAQRLGADETAASLRASLLSLPAGE